MSPTVRSHAVRGNDLSDIRNLIFFGCITLSVMLLVIALWPSQTSAIFIDTDHEPDTLFILGAAWRAHEGLTPAVDFGYFYGGILESGMAATMRVLGHTAFVFEYFSAFIAILLSVVFYLAFRSRISVSALGLLILSSSVLLLTRHPLEYHSIGSGVVSTHSFFYNRFGLVALLAAGLFVGLPSQKRGADLVSGALIGALVALASLVKPTFTILLVGTIAGLLVQSRWHAVVALLGGVLAVVLMVDPQLARWRGAIAYTSAQVAEERGAQLGYLLTRVFRVPLAQTLATLLAVGAIGYVLRTPVSRPALLGVMIVALAGVGMTVTMGGAPGQLALPITIVLALAAAEWAERTKLGYRWPLQYIAVAITLSLALPHAANLVGVAVLGRQRAQLSLVKTGPYAGYVAVEPLNFGASRRPEYEMFADGIVQLNMMGDPSRWGIIADQGMTFEYALLAKPVPGYPLWQRRTAPELAAGRPLPPGADVVMLGRQNLAVSLRDLLTEKMGDRFRRCRTSDYWEVFVRRDLAVSACN